ncbi:MAG TPA: hypothetical protein DEA43_01700 [Candidatus Moranbacteria bacterium]|nr:hypothetical protein [Candidatus Moranbacteria bacterium]
MKKITRKTLSSFLLIVAILLIAGGFSDGMIASADMNSMEDSSIVLHQSVPVNDNALKPCCEDKQGGASAIQFSVFTQNIKFLPLGFAENISGSNSIFEHKIIELSSASPPKPDIISSVFLKE